MTSVSAAYRYFYMKIIGLNTTKNYKMTNKKLFTEMDSLYEYAEAAKDSLLQRVLISENIIIKEILNIKFTIKILFNPDVHNSNNSLSFSNFKIVNIEATRKEKGISFVIILVKARNEYKM